MIAKSIEPVRETKPGQSIAFRWAYIIVPAAVLFLSAVLTIWFYHLLPADVAYHFEDGLPDRWMSRGAIIAWVLIPQLFFALMAAGIVWVIILLSSRVQQEANTAIRKILSLMGNMVALPQLILSFAMLDIFSYNSYRIHLIPLWVFALIVMVLGGIIFGIFFALAVRQAGSQRVKVVRSDVNDGTGNG